MGTYYLQVNSQAAPSTICP